MSPEMGDIVKKWHFRPLKEVVYSVYGEKRASRSRGYSI